MATLELRIDWSDLDLFGHVNNVAYFKYIQAARVGFCEQVGLTSMNEKGKPGFIIAATNCIFKKPLHFPGSIFVHTELEWIKNTSFRINHKVCDKTGETCAEAHDVLVVFDYELNQAVPVSETLRVLMEEKTA